APVVGIEPDAHLVEQDRVGGAIGDGRELGAPVDGEEATAAAVLRGAIEGPVEPARAGGAGVIAARPAAAVEAEENVLAGVRRAEHDGDPVAADVAPALIAAAAGHVVGDAGAVLLVEVVLLDVGQDEDGPVGTEARRAIGAGDVLGAVGRRQGDLDAGGELPVDVVVVVGRQPQLLEVVAAFQAGGGLADLLDGG